MTVIGPTVGLLPDAFLGRAAPIISAVSRISQPDAFLDLLAEGGSGYHFFGRVAEEGGAGAARSAMAKAA